MKKLYCGILLVLSSVAFADPVIVNNNPPPQTPPPQSMEGPPPVPSCNANQNNIYDPRVPPAGVYQVQTGKGSSEMNYTTGEKKPYIVDNNCNSGATQPIPQVYVQPPLVEPGPRR